MSRSALTDNRSTWRRLTTRLSRNFPGRANGSLTFRNCYSENAANGCLEPGGSATLGLSGVEVSPDGQSVYAVAAIDSGITHFSRDTTGKLQFRTCVTAEPTGGCVAPLPALAAVALIALSPDGQSVVRDERWGRSVVSPQPIPDDRRS